MSLSRGDRGRYTKSLLRENHGISATSATSHQRSSYALTLCREASAPPLNETFESNLKLPNLNFAGRERGSNEIGRVYHFLHMRKKNQH